MRNCCAGISISVRRSCRTRTPR